MKRTKRRRVPLVCARQKRKLVALGEELEIGRHLTKYVSAHKLSGAG